MAFLDNSGVTALVTRLKNYFALKEDKQDTLVSGTNIKTINGESILGSGDITAGGGLLITLTISDNTATMDKTAQEIFDALNAGILPVIYNPENSYYMVTGGYNSGTKFIYTNAMLFTQFDVEFTASSDSDYPTCTYSGGGNN